MGCDGEDPDGRSTDSSTEIILYAPPLWYSVQAPATEGWYFCTDADGEFEHVVHLDEHGLKEARMLVGYRWAGPIPTPKGRRP